MVNDVKVLGKFFKETQVPRYKVIVSRRGVVLYIGGDASGAWFGSTVEGRKIRREMRGYGLNMESSKGYIEKSIHRTGVSWRIW